MTSLSSRRSSSLSCSAKAISAGVSLMPELRTSTSASCSSDISIAIGSRLTSSGMLTAGGVETRHGSITTTSPSSLLGEPHSAASSKESRE